ncbi:CFC_collapsed_G0027430.mRNA.1.CDS.1 [Saccharomyces cerevisiae]|nr:CFC_collapsed_G0027430.mRNA.1.CDS.1 [Saccharomyces cerevisiae]
MLLPLLAPTSGLVLLPLPASTSGLVLLPPKVPTPTLVLLPLPASNSSTNATTTASTNSSTNATTTESTNASAKEDANKDGNAEDNRFHPVTDINKESYKRKGSQMVLLERKKLKAQFPNTSENMNVLQFLGFRSDEIKHLFLYGIDVYFCPEGVFTQYGLCKGCQKDVRALCLLGWPESIVSEDGLGSTSCGENAAK